VEIIPPEGIRIPELPTRNPAAIPAALSHSLHKEQPRQFSQLSTIQDKSVGRGKILVVHTKHTRTSKQVSANIQVRDPVLEASTALSHKPMRIF